MNKTLSVSALLFVGLSVSSAQASSLCDLAGKDQLIALATVVKAADGERAELSKNLSKIEETGFSPALCVQIGRVAASVSLGLQTTQCKTLSLGIVSELAGAKGILSAMSDECGRDTQSVSQRRAYSIKETDLDLLNRFLRLSLMISKDLSN